MWTNIDLSQFILNKEPSVKAIDFTATQWSFFVEYICFTLLKKHFFVHSCPFDYVKVYDGQDNSSAVIGTYCGQQRNLVIYSSESSLLVTFVTLPRTANTQNRGFKGIFEFSNSFTKLGELGKFYWQTVKQIFKLLQNQQRKAIVKDIAKILFRQQSGQ